MGWDIAAIDCQTHQALPGATLFQRHAREVKLTAEGRRLADAASAALADIGV